MNTSAYELQLIPDPVFPQNLHQRCSTREAGLEARAPEPTRNTVSFVKSRVAATDGCPPGSCCKMPEHCPQGSQRSGKEERPYGKGANTGVMGRGDAGPLPGHWQGAVTKDGCGEGDKKRKLISVLSSNSHRRALRPKRCK